MKIAIYHNLEKGGALNQLNEMVKILSKNHKIDFYTHKNQETKLKKAIYYIYKINKTKNIAEHIYQAVFELNKTAIKIARDINNKKYDLTIIFPCIITQSPHLIKYLKSNYIYFFTEPKREFYEATNFNHYSIHKIITRLIRYPIKIIDKTNCKKAKYIVTNSYYSNSILKKIYNKNGFVIYPGLKKTKPSKSTLINNKIIASLGQLSKIKGHDFSIKQIENLNITLNILGRETTDTNNLLKISKNNLKIIKTENENKKNNFIKSSSIHLLNQNKEPFGITTLETLNYNRFVLGRNDGGTPEIVQNGVNGILYPNSINIAKKILSKLINKKILTIYKVSLLNWKYSTESLLRLYHFIKNEPNE